MNRIYNKMEHYYPCWISADGKTDNGFTEHTEEEAREYLKNRSENLKKPDKSQWIERRATTTEIIELIGEWSYDKRRDIGNSLGERVSG